jgi:hypothetical protein
MKPRGKEETRRNFIVTPQFAIYKVGSRRITSTGDVQAKFMWSIISLRKDMFQVLVAVVFLFGLVKLLRRIAIGLRSGKTRADRAWLNSLTDANKEFGDIWIR